MKREKFYLKVKKDGKEKEAIIQAVSISNVLNRFRFHNIAILEHYRVGDEINTVEEAKESVQIVTSTVH